MKILNNVNLGSVKIHKAVLAEIAIAAVREVPGVSLVTKDAASSFTEIFGLKHFPGVNITVEKDSRVVIEVKIQVRAGLNIPDAASQTQDAVRTAIEKTANIDLKDVNVNVQGIERGQA